MVQIKANKKYDLILLRGLVVDAENVDEDRLASYMGNNFLVARSVSLCLSVSRTHTYPHPHAHSLTPTHPNTHLWMPENTPVGGRDRRTLVLLVVSVTDLTFAFDNTHLLADVHTKNTTLRGRAH